MSDRYQNNGEIPAEIERLGWVSGIPKQRPIAKKEVQIQESIQWRFDDHFGDRVGVCSRSHSVHKRNPISVRFAHNLAEKVHNLQATAALEQRYSVLGKVC